MTKIFDGAKLLGPLEESAEYSKICYQLAEHFVNSESQSGSNSQDIDKILKNPNQHFNLFEFQDGLVVPYLNCEHHIRMRTNRNLCLIDPDDQTRLYHKKLAVFGNSVGRAISKQFIVGGIGNDITMVDPDIVSGSNLNRLGVGNDQIGSAKVLSTALELSKIDPYVTYRTSTNPYQGEDFGNDTDLVIDEMDDVRSKVLLAIDAREKGVNWMMATDLGHRAIVQGSYFKNSRDERLFGGKISEKEASLLIENDVTPKDEQKFLMKIIGVNTILKEPDLVKSTYLLKQGYLEGIPQLYSTVSKASAYMIELARPFLLGRIERSFREVFAPARLSQKRAAKNTINDFKDILSILLNI